MNKLTLLGLIFGITIIGYILFYSNAMEVFSIILKTNPYFFTIAFLLELSILYLFIERLRIILSKVKKFDFFTIARISLYANAINTLTPILKVGGEPLKIRYLGRLKIKHAIAGSFIAIEILSEVLGLYIVFMLSLFASFLFWNLPYFYFLVGVFSFIFVSILTIFVLKFLFSSHKIEKILKKFVDKNLAKESSALFSKNFKMLLKDKFLFYKTLSLTILSKILEILRIYFVILSLLPNASFHMAILLWIAYIIIGLLPWLPGNLGILEGGAISLFLYLGIDLHLATSIVLLERALSLWLPVIIGFLYKGLEKLFNL